MSGGTFRTSRPIVRGMLFGVQVQIVDHPVVTSELTEMRSIRTSNARFRDLLRRISRHLVFEACRGVPTEPLTVVSPMGPADGVSLAQAPVMIPVLRAGLGMLDGALEVLPDAEAGFLGLKRDENTLRPDAYMNTVPPLDGRPAYILDPMLATGGSACFAADQTREAGVGHLTLVTVLAAPEGVAAVEATGQIQRLVTASIDSHLNEAGFIMPGLGDAGDRQFGVD